MTRVRSTPPMLRMGIDYGPLLVFFLTTFAMPAGLCRALVAPFTHTLDGLTQVEALLIARVIVATVLFVLATIAAVVFSRVRLGHVSPMLLISAALVLVFGGLTVYFHDPRFIQMKPSFVYGILAAVLGFGLATGRPLLEGLLGMAYPGLSPEGWRKLTLNWAVFFALARRCQRDGTAVADLRSLGVVQVSGLHDRNGDVRGRQCANADAARPVSGRAGGGCRAAAAGVIVEGPTRE